MDKPKKTTTMQFTIRTRDIQIFAERELGITLFQSQLNIIDALINRKPLLLGRRAGFNTAKRVLEAFVEQEGGYIKHFDKTHFRAVTAQGRKFVYCPVGNICSWSDGDWQHKWCHWCKKYFNEIGA